MAAASCDFPSDPPIKSQTPVIPPDSNPDSSKALLPLKGGNAWVYVVFPRLRPDQDPRLASAAQIMDDTIKYFEVPYTYHGNGPMPPTYAFPPILRNTRAGLAFYNKTHMEDTLTFTRPPSHAFTLPYPAKVGETWEDASGDVRAVLVSTDTLVYDWSNSFQWKVYRYDVFLRNQLNTTFYILPGSAIIRIEFKNYTFETISWRVL